MKISRNTRLFHASLTNITTCPQIIGNPVKGIYINYKSKLLYVVDDGVPFFSSFIVFASLEFDFM